MRQTALFCGIVYLVVAGFVGFGYFINDSNNAYAQQEVWMDAAQEGLTWPAYIWQFIKG